MQVLVHTDNHVDGSEELKTHVETEVAEALGRFGNRVMRVEVHLHDQNAHKMGERDKRCVMEARIAGLDPIAVTEDNETMHVAIAEAAKRLERTIDRTIDRQRAH
jgi:ribosomal subunit interface protein